LRDTLCSLRSFFFSSRRRHTRSKRDWSSDVCSSDLPVLGRGDAVITPSSYSRELVSAPKYGVRRPIHVLSNGIDTDFFRPDPTRSEERRVGKEGRHRGGTEHYEK